MVSPGGSSLSILGLGAPGCLNQYSLSFLGLSLGGATLSRPTRATRSNTLSMSSATASMPSCGDRAPELILAMFFHQAEVKRAQLGTLTPVGVQHLAAGLR